MKKILFFILILLNSNMLAFNTENSQLSINDFEEEYLPEETFDPLRPYNQFMHKINQKFYHYMLSPILDGYNKTIPIGFRIGIYNFTNNLLSPLRFTGHLLTLDIQNAMNELGRFSLNSTVGLLGILDISSSNHLYSKYIDFGIVLGKWGVGSGFPIVLPLLGPSNLRDAIVMPLEVFTYPPNYFYSTATSLSLNITGKASQLAKNKTSIDNLQKASLNNYVFIRDSYQSYRNQYIKR